MKRPTYPTFVRGFLIFCISFFTPTFSNAQETHVDTVIFDLSQPIERDNNFNWFTRGTTREHGAHQAMWEPLFVVDDKNGTLQPWLGLEITPDAVQKVWTLKLRKDVFWSDKVAFTAKDVEFTARLAIEHDDLPAAEAGTFRSEVDSVKIVDDLTVEFQLREANPRFAIENFGGATFSSFLIMPEHIWKGQDPLTFKFNPPIGTGPYTLASIDDKEVVWQRNDEWWGVKAKFRPLPAPVQLIWRHFPDANTSFERMKADQIDAGREIAPTELDELIAANPKVIVWSPDKPRAWSDPSARQIDINTQNEPWNNANLRKALSFLIDRQAIADDAYFGQTVPSETMFLQNGAMAPFIDEVKKANFGLPPKARIDMGQELIAKEGFTRGADGIFEKGGTDLSLVINFDSGKGSDSHDGNAQDADAAELIAKQLRDAGIAAQAVGVPRGELWGKVIPLGKYQAVYSWLSRASIIEPWASMDRYNVKYASQGQRSPDGHSPAFNNTGQWKSPAAIVYSKIIDDMGKMPLRVEGKVGGKKTMVVNPTAIKAVAAAYAHLDAEMPFIPVVQSAKIIPFSTKRWTGWPTKTDDYVAPMHSWSRALLIIHNLKKVK